MYDSWRNVKQCHHFDSSKQRISCIELPWIFFFVERLPYEFGGFGRFHPRQLLHRLSGSELQLHRESSSNRSESSKLKWSASSQSSRGDPTSTGAADRPPLPLLFDDPATIMRFKELYLNRIRWISSAIYHKGVSTVTELTLLYRVLKILCHKIKMFKRRI